MRSNAYTNCYEYMFVFSKGSPITFNPLQEKTVRSGEELLVHNKKADGVNKKRWAGLIRLKQRQISGSMPWAWGGGNNKRKNSV